MLIPSGVEGSVYPVAVGTGLATGCRLSTAAHPSGSFFPAIFSRGMRGKEGWEGSRTLGCFPYLFRRGRIESMGDVLFGLCGAEPVTGGLSKVLWKGA